MTVKLDTVEAMSTYLIESLSGLGFPIRAGEIRHGNLSKDAIRGLHAMQRAEAIRKNLDCIEQHFDSIAPYFCDGRDVDPLRIDPFIRPASTSLESALFRAASMLWSVPVSQGYGRRNRFLVFDRQNGALVGIYALGDPVFNLAVRDRIIGWNHRDREARLYQCFDAFVLGAVPPYREVLGGKLIALTAISNETRRYLEQKYTGVQTNIHKIQKPATPVLITTTSALGKSSIYNRLKFGRRQLYYSVGFTEGFGHFHIPPQLFDAFVAYLERLGIAPGYSYGQGPNYRMRVVRTALTKLGLNPDLMRHGVKREVFVAPVAHNWREVLRGEESAVDEINLPLRDLAEFFVARWAFPRASRRPEFRNVTARSTLQQIRPERAVMSPLFNEWKVRLGF